MNFHTSGVRERGGALVMAVILMLLVGAMAGSMVVVQFHRDRLKLDYVNKMEAYYGAEGAANYGVESVWTAFTATNGGKAGSLSELRAYLDGSCSPKIQAGTWVSVPVTGLQLGTGVTATVKVLRTDASAYTDLRFQASASILGHTETVETAFRAQGDIFKGFDFGLLSNNISCVFCHATIDSVGKYAGGPYDKVRVATIDSLKARSGASSTVAGTLYSVGELLDNKGNILTTLAGTSLDGYSITSAGKIDPATTKIVDMVPAPLDSSGNPLPNYNLYVKYPTTTTGQTDGTVPTTFPPVFYDANGNRVVDDAEFGQINGTGTASGFGYVVASGSTFGGSTVVSANPVALNGTVNGNVILTGTAANPIKIDGTVTVNGDVVLQGVVKGSGALVARGNIYVTSDLTYNDAVVSGKRTYGVAADGTKNDFALAAGGNILVGDYLTPKGGSLTSTTSLMTGYSAGGFGFVYSQISLFNRNEWQKTQTTLPNSKGVQVSNSTYVSGYTPKYYTIAPGTPVYVFTKGAYWDAVNKTWIGSEHAGQFSDMTLITPSAGSVLSSLDPPSNWITATQLKQFWINDENSRVSGAPFKIDGLVYTDSAVFTLARGASKTNGDMVINGGIVARDTGILAGGSLQLNYDVRTKSLMNLRDTTSVVFSRTLFVKRPPTVVSY
jgi:cytoskeletal protein CcmA (bactofilin family)